MCDPTNAQRTLFLLSGGCRGSGGEIIVKLVPTSDQVSVILFYLNFHPIIVSQKLDPLLAFTFMTLKLKSQISEK